MAGQSERASRRALFLLIVGFLVISSLWAFRVPPPGADGNEPPFNPDEAGQFEVVRYMATHAALPPYRFPYDTSVHPPLYHALAAVIYVSVSGLGPIFTLYVLRLFSCVIGAATVCQTFRAARALNLPNCTALLAAAIVALVPMFVSLSAAISNENLAALGAAGTLATLTEGLRRRFDSRRVCWLAFWLTVGGGSKITCLGLVPVICLALFWSGRRRGLPLASIFRQAAAVLCFLALCLGWWFARNQLMYGDPLRKAAADALWNPVQPGFTMRNVSVSRYAGALLHQGWRSFWGVFDAQRRGFPSGVFAALALFQSAALAGLVRKTRRRNGLLLVAAVFCLPFVLFVGLVYFQYNWAHYTPQGRYGFVLLVPFGIAVATGWLALFPRRLHVFACGMVIAALLSLNLYAVWVYPNRPAVRDTISGYERRTALRPPAPL